MADTTKKKKRKKSGGPKKKRHERRFAADVMQISTGAAAVGALGAIALGAGVYGQWIREPAVTYGTYLVAGGAVGLGVSMWVGDRAVSPVRVGDGGVALEKGSEVLRLMWCDMEDIKLQGDTLTITGDGPSLDISVKAHKLAVAWILKEAAARVPDVLGVKSSAIADLPKTRDEDGESMVLKDVQIAGRRCALSDETVTLERDARVCETCGEVYHHAHVPKSCETCDAPLGQKALRV